ncbi:DUF6999 family protein [Pedobacter westerhofensis]|uniref:DUF6999 family protein n=1 Tax=Pedobacter westerhofensis TaxID=425512 RepID=UPI003742BBFA
MFNAYQFYLTDNDFWRAPNSLQLDELIGIYTSTIMDCPEKLTALNNKHPMILLPTYGAAFRLFLHGFSTEVLHAMLVQAKLTSDLAAATSATSSSNTAAPTAGRTTTTT